MQTSTPRRAIGYTRISDDKRELGEGVGRQDDDVRALASRLGWTIGEMITENDVSAFKRRRVRLPDGSEAMRVVREGFARLIDMIANGEADGLIVYDLDRLARDMRDLEDLIDVVERSKIPVASVTGSLRLASDADIAMARIMTVIANKSSRDTSRRVARKHEALAAEGRPSGGGIRAFGYRRDGITVEPTEAEVIKEIAERIIGGWSLHRIADDMNERQVSTVRGGPWTAKNVKGVVVKARVAGLRTLRGEVVGDAVWSAILDRETWEAVCDVLASRAGSGAQRLVYWLTGSLYCGLCDKKLVAWNGTRGKRFWCATPSGGCGKIAVLVKHAEKEIERRLLEYLGEPDVLDALQRARSAPDSLKTLRADLAEDEAMLAELARAWASKQITFAEYTEARRVIDQRVREAKSVVSGMTPRVVRRLLEAKDTRVGWESLGPFEKREVVKTLVPDGFTVQPAEPHRAVFNPDRIKPRETSPFSTEL